MLVSLLENLNEQQKAAVICDDSHIRIIAGAGSGKTRVVTTRIAYLIEEKHVYPNQVLAITFTNKAAQEMKERATVFLNDMARAVPISTIHSFCVRLLREEIINIDYPRNFQILDSDDTKSILKDIYKQLDIDKKLYGYGSVLGYISGNKTQFIDPKQAKEMAKNWESEQTKAEIYQLYQERLVNMKALDFDDLLVFTHNLLEASIDIRQKWQRRFRYIHVDEFQDVDALQYNIIKMLVGPDSFLCVVGDPDQTIYTWRGAEVDIIMNFENDFAPCKTIILNENYRSTPAILNSANSLIKHNRNRIEKDLFTNNQSEDKITYFASYDEKSEARWICDTIYELHSRGEEYRNIAVLYRSNYLSRGLENSLMMTQIPYRIYGGIRFYDRSEIKDALSYLKLLLPDSNEDEQALWKDLAVQRIINVPKRGIGQATLDAIVQEARNQNINMYEVLKQKQVGKGKAKLQLGQFVDIIEKYRLDIENTAMDRLLELVLNECGYLPMLQEQKETERIENIKALLQDMQSYMEENEEATIEEYLQNVTLLSDNEEYGSDVVSLMTIHAAKGLEFDHVFVYSVCDGIFPNERSVSEGGIPALEEERRLAYVAFTRAKKYLYITSSQGYDFILNRAKTPSPFIDELSMDYIERVGFQAEPRSQISTTSTYETKSFMERKVEEKRPTMGRAALHEGDLITHKAFGDGVVLKIKNGIAEIAFEKKFGIRKLMANHPSITKK